MTTFEIICSIVTPLLTFAAVIVSYYFMLKKKIEEVALDAINSAEDLDVIGAEKFKEAVAIVQEAIPVAWRMMFPQPVIEAVVQMIFDKVQEFAKKQIKK